LIGGDFNYVLEATAPTGHGTFSRSLTSLGQGYEVRNVWQANSDRRVHTHYTAHGATRLDGFYPSTDLLVRKKGNETDAAAFTDHFAVVLRLSLDAPIVRRGRGTWKLNKYISSTNHVIEKIKLHWTR